MSVLRELLINIFLAAVAYRLAVINWRFYNFLMAVTCVLVALVLHRMYVHLRYFKA